MSTTTDRWPATLCDETGFLPRARDGVCPVHHGDACLHGGPAVVADLTRLRSENERLREGLWLCLDDFIRYAPAYWRARSRGEAVARHLLEEGRE